MAGVGIVLAEGSTAEGEVAERARALGLTLATDADAAGFERWFQLGSGAQVPWELVEAGLRFVERWEAAAPLSTQLAGEIGSAADRALTLEAIRDLRVPVYASELLFVRRCPAGLALLEAWSAECASGGHPRLAFLRAVYRVKPRFLGLPRTWLQGPGLRSAVPLPSRRSRLVRVMVAPGRYTQCLPEHAEEYRERYRAKKRGG